MQAVINAIWFRLRKGPLPGSGSSLEAKVNKSIVVSFGVRFLSIAVTFLAVPLAIQTLNKHDFGIWMVLFSLVNWLVIVETAVINYLRNELIACFVAEDDHRAKQVVAAGLCTAALVAGGLILTALVANGFGLTPALLRQLGIHYSGIERVFLVVVVGYSLQMIVKLYNGILLADHKVHVTATTLLIANLASFLVVLTVHRLGINSLLAFAVVQSFTPILIYGAFFGYGLRELYRHLIPTGPHWRAVAVRSVLGQSGSFFVLQLASTLMFTSGSLVVGRYFTTTDVTTYAVAAKYYSLIPTFYGILIAPYWSAFGEAYLKRDGRWIRATMHKLHRFCLLTLVLALGLLAVDNSLCRLWLNNAVEIPLGLSVAFTFYSVSYALLSNYNYFTNAIGKLRLSTTISALGCVLFFPLNHVFINVLGLGMPGVVWVSTGWCVLLALCCRYQYQKSLDGL